MFKLPGTSVRRGIDTAWLDWASFQVRPEQVDIQIARFRYET